MVAYRRKRGTARPVSLGTLFPDKARLRMNYMDTQSRSTSGAVGVNGVNWQYRLNSLFDPDFTTGGHQPRGRDQWSAIYQNYYIPSCTIAVKMANTGLTNDFGGWIAISQGRDTINPLENTSLTTPFLTNYDTLERATDPLYSTKLKHFSAMGGGSSQWVFLSKKFYLRKVVREDPFEDVSSAFRGNPGAVHHGYVTVKMPQSSAAKSFYTEVRLIMDVILFNPVSVTVS